MAKKEGSGSGPECKEGGGWKRELTYLLSTKGRVTSGRANLKPVSNRTIEMREREMFLCFKQLEGLGFKIPSVHSLGTRHVMALTGKWESENLTPSTITVRISMLRILAEWIDKKGMIGAAVDYVSSPDVVQRKGNAQRDHSWSARGINAKELIARVYEQDRYVGIQLMLMSAFALRREESVMFKPFRADRGGHIVVRDGTKGGRERTVTIDTDHQREVLALAKTIAGTPSRHVGHPDKSLKQALDHFTYLTHSLGISRAGYGITPHGLRHEALNDLFERISGIASPVRGGDVRLADPLKLDAARSLVSATAGHARLSISGAYLGGMLGNNRKYDLDDAERDKLREYTRIKHTPVDARTLDEHRSYGELSDWFLEMTQELRL